MNPSSLIPYKCIRRSEIIARGAPEDKTTVIDCFVNKDTLSGPVLSLYDTFLYNWWSFV